MPELCLLAIFSQMNATDKIMAVNVCPKWHWRIKELHRDTQSLTVAIIDIIPGQQQHRQQHFLDKLLNWYSLCTGPHVGPLMTKEGNRCCLRHPTVTWNCLQFAPSQLTSALVQQIISAFPAISQLTFACHGHWSTAEFCHLRQMLTSPPKTTTSKNGRQRYWRPQLISLSVVCRGGVPVGSSSAEADSAGSPQGHLRALYAAINELPAIKSLTLDNLKLERLPILRRLSHLNLRSYFAENMKPLLQSLKQYARAKKILKQQLIRPESLSVELYECDDRLLHRLNCLGGPLRGVFRRLNHYPLPVHHSDHLFSLKIANFSNLTSLALEVSVFFYNRLLFVLSRKLCKLVYLKLRVNFIVDPDDRDLVIDLPTAKLVSVQALDLMLVRIFDHSLLQLLNVPVTLPNLRALHLDEIQCTNCCFINFQKYPTASFSTARNCLQSVLKFLHNQSSGVPLCKLTYNKEEIYGSAKILLQNAY